MATDQTQRLDVNLLNTALVLLDDNYHICQLNTAAEQLLGFSNRQLENETFFDLVKSELSQSVLKSFRNQASSGFIEDFELKVATGIIRANLMVTPCKIETSNDLLLEIQVSTHNQNIRKDLQLLRQSRISEHLIQNLAHEIKNPLGGIKGAAQLLERKLPADFSHQYSQIIINESNRLSALVDRLLMPATPEAAQLTNIHRLIEDAVAIVLLQFEHSFQLIKDYDPSLPDINISPNQIQQTLLNLIKNAAEAIQQSDKNFTDGYLTIRTRMMHQHTIGKTQHRQVIRVDIEDNGVGIPEELTSDIFFPTISGKQSSGLGLSIAQSLIQRHKGIIELEKHSLATCFSIYLPL